MPAYEFQPFPSYRFHRSGAERIVQNQQESDELGPGWQDSLVFEPEAAPAPEAAPEKPRRKR